MTIGAVLVMGFGGGLLLATVQAALADHHGERRAVALAEANVAASVAYLALAGALSLTAALHAGWRVALLVALVIPVSCGGQPGAGDRRAAATRDVARGRLPRAFWTAAAVLFCVTAAEWCVTAWGATFVEDATHVSADIAVGLMAGYFGGVVVGRALGSRLARRTTRRACSRWRSPSPPSGSRSCGPPRTPRRPWPACRCSGWGWATCSR